jgi:hypothetical protein
VTIWYIPNRYNRSRPKKTNVSLHLGREQAVFYSFGKCFGGAGQFEGADIQDQG